MFLSFLLLSLSSLMTRAQDAESNSTKNLIQEKNPIDSNDQQESQPPEKPAPSPVAIPVLEPKDTAEVSKAASPTPTSTPTPARKERKKRNREDQAKIPSHLEGFEWRKDIMQFDPIKNGVKILTPQLTFSVDKTEDLIVSGVVFNQDTFKATLGPLNTLSSSRVLPLSSTTVVLLITAPLALGIDGKIEVIGEDGGTLFQRRLDKDNFSMGSQIAKALPSGFWKSTKISEVVSILMVADDMKKTLMNLERKSGFRFCWTANDDDYFSKFCTPLYRYSKKDAALKIQTQTGSTRVYLNQKEVAPEGKLDLPPGTDGRFLATNKQGFSVEFTTQSRPLFLTDYFLNADEDSFFLTGHTNFPTSPNTKIFRGIDPDSLGTKFNWNATIAKPKDYWTTLIPVTKPSLVLPGRGGGLIHYPLEINKIPTGESRLILKAPPTSTYISDPNILGEHDPGVEVSAKPPSKVKLSKKSNAFLWTFPTPNKGEEQTASLLTRQNDQEFVANYDLFRGYSGEFSFRLAGILAADLRINLLSEFAYNQWFESLLGWNNSILSKQRWGISLRTLSTLSSFTPKGAKSEVPLTLKLTTFDLKYRLTPGLWERDETWGLILGTEDISISNRRGTLAGAGWFWARSMPQVFDDIFNWFPYMSYPKWVDMEMLYYFLPTSNSVKTGTQPTYAINFHGKVLWKKYLFGEAGFGIKAYNYVVNPDVKALRENVKMQALYGTIGLGFNF